MICQTTNPGGVTQHIFGTRVLCKIGQLVMAARTLMGLIDGVNLLGLINTQVALGGGRNYGIARVGLFFASGNSAQGFSWDFAWSRFGRSYRNSSVAPSPDAKSGTCIAC